jgi:anti-sigma factor RsiW
MTCFHLRKSLFLHAHQQLGGVPRLVVQHHLTRCAECRAEWQQWSEERCQWRRALVEEVYLNGSAGRLQAAVAQRIRLEPRGAVAAAPRALPRRRVSALAIVALVLALLATAVAAFGPAVRTDIHRAWLHFVSQGPSCEGIPPVNRTPPGGQEDPYGSGVRTGAPK